MLIILDIGANDGCSVLKFKDILKEKNIDEYQIYSFEPNPFFKNYLNNVSRVNKNVKVHMNLVGTKNKKTKLYISNGDNAGSSIFQDKKTNKINEKIFVICKEVNIVEIIKNLPKHDELWLKLDVEGAEYNIIPHLQEFDCIKLINKLFIEWHYKKIPSITKEMHDSVFEIVKYIDIEEWDATDYSDKSIEARIKYKRFLNNLKNKNILLRLI